MSETIQAKAQTLLVAAEELSNNLLAMPAADIKEADKMTPEVL